MLSWGSMLRTARAPIGVFALGVLGTLVPPQTQDMMAAMEDRWYATVPFHIALALLAFTAWYWSRAVLAARFEVRDDRSARAGLAQRALPVDRHAFEWVPRLLFLAAALLGVALLVGSPTPGNLLVTIAWAVAALLVLRSRQNLALVRKHKPAPWIPVNDPQRRGMKGRLWYPISRIFDYAPISGLPGRILLLSGIAVFLLGAIESFVPQQALPEHWHGFAVFVSRGFPGPSIAILGLALMIGPLSALTFIVDRRRFQLTICNAKIGLRRPPVFTFLALWIFEVVPYFFEAHAVRTAVVFEKPQAIPIDPRHPLSEMLERWAVCRDPSGSGPLRPVIVAISGGATRAGLWGARVLQAVDEAAGEKRNPVFAVSSVSGGSLGAAAYLALYGDERGCAVSPKKPTDGSAFLPLRGDALGPLLAGRLLGDLPRALITPVAAAARHMTGSSPRGGDSAEAIERAFEALWRPMAEQLGGADFSQPYLSLFYRNGAVRPGMPIWLANGTDAGTGNRLMTVPFLPDNWKDPNDCRKWPIQGGRDVLGLLHADVQISTAINNTARFPFLEPFGALLNPDTGKRAGALVDGGYFENEGLETALDLADWLEDCGSHLLSGNRRIEPIIVQATGNGDKSDAVRCGLPVDGPLTSSKKNVLQLFAPLLGVYDVRGGHSNALLHRARDRYCAKDDPRFFHFYLHRLDGKDVPLNWVLSRDVANGLWSALLNDSGNQREFEALKAGLAH